MSDSKYSILMAPDPQTLVHDVTRELGNGYEPIGGMVVIQKMEPEQIALGAQGKPRMKMTMYFCQTLYMKGTPDAAS